MTANRGLFVRNNGTVGTTPAEGRLVLAELVAENSPGVPRQGLLNQVATQVVTGTATMSYDVAACTPVLNRAANEGVYIMTLTGTTNVATSAAPGAGLSRWDLIYVMQHDPDKGDADNLAVVGVQEGTAATSPTKPTADLPAGAYVLAEALVQSGATGTNTAQVAITQVWRYTALRGAPIPVRSLTERDEITAAAMTMVRRLDIGGTPVQTYDGSIWRGGDSFLRPFGHMGRTAGFQSLSGITTVQMDAAQILRGGVTFDNPSDALVVPVAGFYRIHAQGYFSGTASGADIVYIAKNGAGTGLNARGVPTGSDTAMHLSGVVQLAAGDKLSMQAQSGGQQAWGGNGYDGMFLEVEYFAPAETY